MNYYRVAIWAPDASFSFLCGGTADEVRAHIKDNVELCKRLVGAPLVVDSLLKANLDRRDQFLNGDNILFLVERI